MDHKGWMMIAVFDAIPYTCTLAAEALKQRAQLLVDQVENKDTWGVLGKYESDMSRLEELLQGCNGSGKSVKLIMKELRAAKKGFGDGLIKKSKQMLEEARGTTDGWEAHPGFYAKVIKTNEAVTEHGAEKNLHHMNFDQCEKLASKIGGRLPEINEVDAILGGKPHPYGEGHDSWCPCYNKGEKDWVQTGDPNRYCKSHRSLYRSYPPWGEETHEMHHRGWMHITVMGCKWSKMALRKLSTIDGKFNEVFNRVRCMLIDIKLATFVKKQQAVLKKSSNKDAIAALTAYTKAVAAFEACMETKELEEFLGKRDGDSKNVIGRQRELLGQSCSSLLPSPYSCPPPLHRTPPQTVVVPRNASPCDLLAISKKDAEADGLASNLASCNFDDSANICKSLGGRLPTYQELKAFLGTKGPHPYAEGKDCWIPCHTDGKKDWVQTGSCHAPLQKHSVWGYPDWGHDQHAHQHRGWMIVVAFPAKDLGNFDDAKAVIKDFEGIAKECIDPLIAEASAKLNKILDKSEANFDNTLMLKLDLAKALNNIRAARAEFAKDVDFIRSADTEKKFAYTDENKRIYGDALVRADIIMEQIQNARVGLVCDDFRSKLKLMRKEIDDSRLSADTLQGLADKGSLFKMMLRHEFLGCEFELNTGGPIEYMVNQEHLSLEEHEAKAQEWGGHVSSVADQEELDLICGMVNNQEWVLCTEQLRF